MDTLIKQTSAKMEKTVQHLETEFSEVRAGRANPAVLDKIRIDYYDTPTAINQLAAVSVTEARTLTIQPWDASVLRKIEKAIQTSDIGINPQNDGKVIRMIFPPLTEDRRKEIVKDIAKMGEDAKVAVRSIRRESMEKLKSMKKKSEITEDDQKTGEKKIQDITDKNIKTIESLTEKKQKQIMEI
ncbi:MAG: ribosome recycling factor [Clostridia bacterium]|nr:ribosome recycling factor [Clostridia bacterium]